MKKLLLLPLLFIPVIVAFIFEYYLDSFEVSRFQNLAENTLFTILIFTLVSLIKHRKTRTTLFIVSYILLALSIWFESCFFYLYENNFNASTVFILIETNFSETREFLSSYADQTLTLFTLIMFLPLIVIVPYLVKQLRSFSWFIKPTNNRRITAAIIVSAVLITTLKLTTLIVQNLPYLFVKTSIQYAQQSNLYDNIGLTDKVGYFKNSIRKISETNETYIVVIGESHTRHKMSLYGYDRPTNPKLEAIKDSLIIFDDVISPNTHTIKSLEKALLLTEASDSTSITKGSVIQLFNSVGFKSFWLSNQRPVGLHENLLTKMARAADEAVFTNMANYDMITPYDEVLLEPIQKALDDPYPKKVIFVHLLGNHIDYNKRYPETFEVFKTIDDKYLDIENIIDAYDNATVYNDYILNEIITKLKQQEEDALMLYFADHGEEVYETQDAFGHFEGEASKPMYDIPFFLWVSDGFKEHRPIRYRTHRAYMTNDLIHSIGHLTNIKFEGYDASKSVFSIYFEEKPRIIQGDIDYDKLYE